MGDTGSLNRDSRRRSNKSNKVNRIIELFEIPRPNKQRGLQRTNSLPATRRPASLTTEDEDKNSQIKTLFGRPYSGRVKKIKEEIEQKSKTEPNSKNSTVVRKKTRSKRRNCDSEGSMDDVLEEDKKKIMNDLLSIRKKLGKIEIVTEDIENSDTELEITFDNVPKNHDNVFQNSEECNEKVMMRGKEKDEDDHTVFSRQSSDTIVNSLSSDNLLENQDLINDEVKVSYGEYVVGSGIVSYSKSTSSESESDDRLSQENDTEVDNEANIENRFGPDQETSGKTTFSWLHKYSQLNDENDEEETTQNRMEDEEGRPEDTNNSEVDSVTWWTHKSFVQVNRNNNASSVHHDQDDDIPVGNEDNTNEYSESSTSSLEKGRRFIKNQASRLSQRSNRRRTGILVKSQTVKDLARRFEGFKDAAEKGETEHYRKSVIDEMDKELENMRNDGFEDNFHLSFENLTALDYEDDDNVNKHNSSMGETYSDEHEAVNSDEDSSPQFQTIINVANQQEATNDFEVRSSVIEDDPFGETLFSEDLEHGLYYVESFNADGKELIMCSVQIDRQSVDLNKLDEVKSKSQSNLLAQQDGEKTLILMGGAEGSNSRLSLNDSNIGTESNNGTDSKRTTIYSTTSGDSFDERLTDDEGIDIESSSNSYGYSAARRETYCDDQGIVRIERIAPYPKNVEEDPEYMNTTNYYYTIDDEAKEEEENYYDSIRLEHEITVCIPEVKKETLQYIVEEIKATERKYVGDMRRVLNQYKPFLEERCPDKVPVVFGNMEDIYLKQIEFLETLDNSEDEIKEVVQAFIDFEDLFRLYPRYFKNTPKANVAVKELADIIKEKQEQLNDKLHLSAYLLTPLQRLGKYKLFLENITKQLKKEEKSVGSVQMALEIIKKYMSRGNDAVAVGSILHSPLHYKDYGSFVTREKFTLLKPKRMELMVFLFQEAVIFTTEDQRSMEQFIYWQSIKTDDLRIATFDDTTIHLTDYTKTKRRHTSKYTFVLDAKTQKLKNAWKNEVEEILWKQLKKVKENTIKEYQSGKKVPKKLGRNRVKSTGSSVFYVE